jgi:hypothetical protein
MAEKDKKQDALDEKEIRAIGAGIVAEAKRTSKYDQGTLWRSIAFTYIKGEMIFRQIYYGVYNENSQLEKIAAKKVPNGVPWKVILTKFGGGTYEVGRTRTGRASQRSIINTLLSGSTTAIKKLIARNKAKRAKKNKE